MDSLRKAGFTVMYSPIKYDKYVVREGDVYKAYIQYDDILTLQVVAKDLELAQKVLDYYPPDVFDCAEVPWSIFCPIGKAFNV